MGQQHYVVWCYMLYPSNFRISIHVYIYFMYSSELFCWLFSCGLYRFCGLLWLSAVYIIKSTIFGWSDGAEVNV